MKYISKEINITLNLKSIEIGSISLSSTLISKCPNKVLIILFFILGTVKEIFITSDENIFCFTM